MKFIVFDIETTGLDTQKDDVLELYAGCFNLKGELLDELHRYIKNTVPISEKITEITGITQQMIDEKGLPGISVAREWKDFGFKNKCQTLVGHNAFLFDYILLSNWVIRTNSGDEFKLPSFHTFKDTMILSSAIRKTDEPGFRGWMKLQAMCDWLHVAYDPTEFHSAKFDVNKTAQCYLKLIKK